MKKNLTRALRASYHLPRTPEPDPVGEGAGVGGEVSGRPVLGLVVSGDGEGEGDVVVDINTLAPELMVCES